MAAFVMKRLSFGASGPRGRRAALNDANMTKVLDAYRAAYGQVAAVLDAQGAVVTPARAYTDDEITDKIFDGLLQGLVDQGNAQARITASKTASDAVAAVSVTPTSDNTP